MCLRSLASSSLCFQAHRFCCWLRSSERFHTWLLTNRLLGSYIHRYEEHRSMTRRHKVFTLVPLWGVIGLSAVVGVDVWWDRVLLGVVAVGVTVHLLWIPGE